MSEKEVQFVRSELKKLISEKVIERITVKPTDCWVSNIFLRPKKDGSYRMILNLKPLNKFVAYHKFKMKGIYDVLKMVHKNFKMISIDLKQAYFHVAISQQDQKYMIFKFDGQYYKFCVLPNGLASGPRIFVRLSKVIAAYLHKKLIDILIYIDDSFMCADNEQILLRNRDVALQVFQSCGFTINYAKSQLSPTNELEFLGFEINTKTFCITLTKRKREIIFRLCKSAIQKDKISIRFLAKIIGCCVATFPATDWGQLHYRSMERFKTMQLAVNNNNWKAKVTLNVKCKSQIVWWINNIFSQTFCRSLEQQTADISLFMDSSKSGWGCSVNGTDRGASGHFVESDMNRSINSKELLAILFSLKCHVEEFKNKTTMVFTDNRTALSCLQKKGSQNYFRDVITQKIFKLCYRYNIVIIPNFIPGKNNKKADFKSRKYRNPRVEWSLDIQSIQFIRKKLPECKWDIDLFASHLNKKHSVYVSWHKDPEAHFVNAFNLDWSQFKCPFLHPPFSQIHKCLNKIINDKVTNAVMIVPFWATKVWYSQMVRMCIRKPILMPKNTAKLMTLPWDKSVRHPLCAKLRLLLVNLFANCLHQKVSPLNNVPICPNSDGENPLLPAWEQQLIAGRNSVKKRKKINSK